MSSYGRSKRVKREKWANRMAVLGVTMVVLCLAVAVNAKGSTLKKSDLDYQQKEKQLEEQVREEEERTKKLEEYKVYVKTKQFAEEVAEKTGGAVEVQLYPSGQLGGDADLINSIALDSGTVDIIITDASNFAENVETFSGRNMKI